MSTSQPPSCAIAMCDLSEENTKETDRALRLLPCCSSNVDHKMHEGCIRKLCLAIGTPLACPLCRDNMLETLRQLLTFRNEADYRYIEQLQPVLAAFQNTHASDDELEDIVEEQMSAPVPNINEDEDDSDDPDWLPETGYSVIRE